MKLPIYMDYNATTPVDKRVLDAMVPFFCERFGNAASKHHAFGWQAEEAIDNARKNVADLLSANAREIIFTSGATESDNLAIKGVAQMYRENGNHIITCLTEHKAVLDTCEYLEKNCGFDVTYLPPDEFGRVSPQQVADAITDKTILITLMAANNEIGTLHPIAEIGKIAKSRGVIFHTDATQSAGKIPIDVQAIGADLLSLSAHKIYGPKGVGALYVRGRDPRVRLAIQMHGGGHERGMRSGTLNVPGIVGLGTACEIARDEMESEGRRLADLRDRLSDGITSRVKHVRLNGHPTERLPNTANLSFEYIEGEAIMMKIKDVAVSSASACTSATLAPSHVLTAIGLGDEIVHGSIRFSLGRFTTAEEVDYTIDHIAEAVEQLLKISPLYDLAKAGTNLESVEWNE